MKPAAKTPAAKTRNARPTYARNEYGCFVLASLLGVKATHCITTDENGYCVYVDARTGGLCGDEVAETPSVYDQVVMAECSGATSFRPDNY